MLITGPIVAFQGELTNGILRFPNGPVMAIKSLSKADDPIAVFEDTPCLQAGEFVHIKGRDSCCVTHFSTYEVVSIDASNRAELSLVSGYPARDLIENAEAVRALNLDGFTLAGVVASRNPNVRPTPGIYGAIARGSKELLITAPISAVSQGDRVDMAAAGLAEATVTGVYTSGPVAAPSTALERYGCGSRNSICPAPPVSANSARPIPLVVTLDKEAQFSVSNSRPSPVEITGQALAKFKFTVPEGAHGVAEYQLDLRRLARLQLPSDQCSNQAYKIGCYQIAMIQGNLPANNNYPPANYYNWLGIIGAGDVALRPTFLNLFLDTIDGPS
jgi:hypothetical protein